MKGNLCVLQIISTVYPAASTFLPILINLCQGKSNVQGHVYQNSVEIISSLNIMHALKKLKMFI
jgi:hypothetical protein